MYELKQNGKVFTSKFVGTGPSSYEKEFTGPRSHKGSEILLYSQVSRHDSSEPFMNRRNNGIKMGEHGRSTCRK